MNLRAVCALAALTVAGCAPIEPDQLAADQRDAIRVASRMVAAQQQHYDRYRTHTSRMLDLVAMDPSLDGADDRYKITVQALLDGDAYRMTVKDWGSGEFVALRAADGSLHLRCTKESRECRQGRWKLTVPAGPAEPGQKPPGAEDGGR